MLLKVIMSRSLLDVQIPFHYQSYDHSHQKFYSCSPVRHFQLILSCTIQMMFSMVKLMELG